MMYDMDVIARDFIKKFAYFKQQAMSGTPVKLVDRRGRRFVFKMDKTFSHCGAGKKLSKGIPLSPGPVDKSEWRDLM